jgi:hypothetical protein
MVVRVIAVVVVRVRVHAAVGVPMLVDVRRGAGTRRCAVGADGHAVDSRFSMTAAASRAHPRLLRRFARPMLRRSRFP